MSTKNKTLPLIIHTGIIIQALTDHPEDLETVSPGYGVTAEELCALLRTDPRKWVVDGLLSAVPERTESQS